MTGASRPVHQVLLQAGLPRENKLPKAGAGQGLGAGLGAIDISGMVKRVRTIETIGQPNASFEIGLTFQNLGDAVAELGLSGTPALDNSLNLVVVPQNICDISLGGGIPGRDLTSVLQGVVTRVFERTTISEEGQPYREVVLAGESWGGILTKHEIPAHVFSARFQTEKELAQLIELEIMLDGPCGLVEQKFYDRIFTKQTNPLQLKTQSVFAFDIDQSLFSAETGVTYQGNVWQRQGTLWTTMRSLADEPWNELFATWNPAYEPQGPGDGLTQILPPPPPPVPPRKFVIRLRRRPFDQKRWEALPTHEVRDDELRYQEWALADDERLNWIAIETPTTFAAGEQHAGFLQFMYSRFDLDDAEAHGARLRRFPTQYNDRKAGAGTLLTDPREHERFAQGEGEAAEIANDRVQRVWDWFNINHRLYRGTVVCRGRPEIHVGTRFTHQRDPSSYFVTQESERRVAYIETVVQDYVDGHHYFTHLALTRGQPIDGFLVPWVDGKKKTRGGGPEEAVQGS